MLETIYHFASSSIVCSKSGILGCMPHIPCICFGGLDETVAFFMLMSLLLM